MIFLAKGGEACAGSVRTPGCMLLKRLPFRTFAATNQVYYEQIARSHQRLWPYWQDNHA